MNGIAERFATACDAAGGSREVRDLADEFALDVIRALRNATLAEIAETVAVLETKHKARAEERAAARKRAPKSHRSPVARSSSRFASVSAASPSQPPDAGPSSRRDPFDITKPGELLTEVATRREEERPPASVRQVRTGSDAMPAILSAPSKPAPAATAPQAPPPPPAVALREGEQLLRVGGSGAVIRRARTA